jgi:vacuolar-type H+-ATPase subunit I/STV1
MAVIDLSVVEELVAVRGEIKALNDKLKDVKAREQELERATLQEFEVGGLSRLTVGDTTLYMSERLWASPATSKEEMLAALEQAGFPDLVLRTYNSPQLSSFVRELVDEQGVGLPSVLEPHIQIVRKYSINSRKA